MGSSLLFALGALAFSSSLPAQVTPAPAPAAAPEPTAEQWRAIARQDVLAGYDIYVANHPGMHDPANPGFPAQLKRARDAALRVADKAGSRAGYQDALGTFSAELSDGHASLFAISPPAAANAAPQEQWPGFVTAFRGKQLVVHHAGPGSPAPSGSVISACDGKPVADVIRARLLSRGFRPREAGHWWARAPQAFTSGPSFSSPPPRRCTFRTPTGKTLTAPLTWRPAPDNLAALLTASTDGEKTPIGLSEPRPGIFLVGLTTFQPDEEGIKAYRALFETLRARGDELKRAKAVVLDLRHNSGGSAAWPRDTAKALWGDAAVETRLARHFQPVRIHWRASKGNTDYMRVLEEQVRRNGHDAASIARIGEGMRASLAQGEPFFLEGKPKPPLSQLPPPAPTDFTTPVYVLTAGRCASACLDALDGFTRFPNVTLIGAPTSADTTYMEVRSEVLPSGKGRIVIPNKMWVGRPRVSGQIYEPKILMTDLDWSTRTFLDRIEKDLPKRN